MIAAGGALRSTIRRTCLQLVPTSRSLCIATDDDRIEGYVHAAYGHLVADVATVEAHSTDYGSIITRTRPARVTFNESVLPRPPANEPLHQLNSGPYLVDQFVWRSLAREPAWLSLYGCAVALDGGAIAIVGPSGAGKTTLGLALAQAGAGFYGDEMIVIKRSDGTLSVIERRVAVRERTLSLLDHDVLREIVAQAESFPEGNAKTYLVPRAALDAALGPAPPPLPLRALVVLRPPDGSDRLERISLTRAAVLTTPFFGARPGDLSEVAALAAMLAGGAAFEMTASDPAAAAKMLTAALSP